MKTMFLIQIKQEVLVTIRIYFSIENKPVLLNIHRPLIGDEILSKHYTTEYQNFPPSRGIQEGKASYNLIQMKSPVNADNSEK